MAAHDDRVPYEKLIVPSASIDLGTFGCRALRDGNIIEHYAAGPCPGCGAEAQGHKSATRAPIEALGKRVRAVAPPAESVEIELCCQCGYDHGRPGGNGCGRRWTIICSARQP